MPHLKAFCFCTHFYLKTQFIILLDLANKQHLIHQYIGRVFSPLWNVILAFGILKIQFRTAGDVVLFQANEQDYFLQKFMRSLQAYTLYIIYHISYIIYYTSYIIYHISCMTSSSLSFSSSIFHIPIWMLLTLTWM